MILIVDNYDSFTHNLVHLIGGLGHDVRVVRNDALSADEALRSGASAIVLSPGPCTPNEAGVCAPLAGKAAAAGVPVFGVCLGMQSIAQAFGGAIVRAGRQVHGKTSTIEHNGDGLFQDLPREFSATRYHSLVVDPESVPPAINVTATSADDGEIMAVSHVAAPIAGVQFHPESIASEYGSTIFENFLAWARQRKGERAAAAPAGA